jgi:prepilin-type N-terminal cleavage/methylation domain-containing protein
MRSTHEMNIWRRRRGGFTLVELVVAMVVTAIMVAIIGLTFMAQNRLYRRQHDIGRTQQNLRLAMEVVSKDIALAGFGAGANGQFYGVAPDSDMDSPLEALVPADNAMGDGPDAIHLAYSGPTRAEWGFLDKTEASSGSAMAYQCDTQQLRFTPNTALAAQNFDSGNLLWDKVACFSSSADSGLGVSFVWNVVGQGDPVTGYVDVAPNTQADFAGKCASGHGLPEEMACTRLIQVAYYIDRDGDGAGPGTPALPYLMISFDEELDDIGDDIPIAAGIEDMQLNYCMQLEDCDAINWASRSSIPPGMYFADVSRIRLRMVARSERMEEYDLPASAPVDLDTADTFMPSNTPDTYHRRVAHQIITLRNARAAKQVRDEY